MEKDRKRIVARQGKNVQKKGGRKMGMEGAVLLETFSEQLTIIREFGIIEPERLGRDMAQSLVVEARVVLAVSDRPSVELPSVGTLFREGETVLFKPVTLLEKDVAEGKLRLGDFLDKKVGVSRLWGEFTWHTFFRKSPEPYPGLDLLARLGSWLLQSRIPEDPKLEKVSFAMLLEGLCLGVHDAICCGAGIELETIGMFYPNLKFEADKTLLDTIKHQRALTNPEIGASNFKVSRL